MKSIKELSGTVASCSNGICMVEEGVFDAEEVEKAEAIVKVLDGMTIASARELLKKLDDYMLQSIFNAV